jgi:hypothetical protein
MKNIHILPTDKPSRLYLGNNENFVFGMMQTSIQSRNDDFTNQNIYITSDEEIKEGDWFISLYSNSIQRELKLDWTLNKDAYKKIILTTDQDLIKDGVQAIDDTFLEWFVKNPSCEEVEVAKTNKLIDNYADKDEDKWEVKYHIYLPKEEPKQETLEEVLGSSMCQYSVIENKLAILYRNQVKIYDAVTKEQQVYSEEEVKDIMAETWIRCVGNDGNDFKELRDKILEQFKNI